MATYKKSVSVSGNWAKANEIASGTKAKIKSETNPIPSQFKNDDGSAKMQNVAKVLFQGSVEPVNMNLNRNTIDGLVEAFGEDSKNWIDKVLTAHTEKMLVSGRRVTGLYLLPEGFEVAEDEGGYMVVRRIQGLTAPQTTQSYPEINPSDIPF